MRLIDADALKQHYAWWGECGDKGKENKRLFDEIIDLQPTIGGWVSCKDKLPDYGQAVLTWDGNTYQVEKRIEYILDEEGRPVYSDWWVSGDWDEDDSIGYPGLRDGAADYWQPIPTPPEVE